MLGAHPDTGQMRPRGKSRGGLEPLVKGRELSDKMSRDGESRLV
jgi:hypothetical protein